MINFVILYKFHAPISSVREKQDSESAEIELQGWLMGGQNNG